MLNSLYWLVNQGKLTIEYESYNPISTSYEDAIVY